jgi:magnesium chelatase family protein
MKLTCIQMDMVLGAPDANFARAEALVRRAAEVAAAGMHNFLMIGSPGAGKTMIARRLPTILPRLTMEESLEISRVYSACGLLTGREGLVNTRPFRAPHHTISPNALAGGGRRVRPGEISLATRGVLFLDELPEFSTNALEVLRQPLEEGQVTISRTSGNYVFPAHFQLTAAMNIATTKLIQWETAEKPENKAFRGFCGFIFSFFEPVSVCGSSSVF